MSQPVRLAFAGLVASLAMAGLANKALSRAEFSLDAQPRSAVAQSDLTEGMRAMITLGAFGTARLSD